MRIAVVALEDGGFSSNHFLVEILFPHFRAAGHALLLCEGVERLPEADLGFLHVDVTKVPEDYLTALRRYPLVINGAVRDIGKRSFSELVIGPDDPWRGQVIVKTDNNCGGMPEAFRRKIALEKGRDPGPPVRFMRSRYPVFASKSLVPPAVFLDPDLVVEKFVPEQDERGYYVRNWLFFGDRERCSRMLGTNPVLKASDAIERVPVPVPDELRVLRERLCFDYGKFDFVIHEGKPILLDVNRTPTVPPILSDTLEKAAARLAEGLEVYVQRAVKESVGQRSPSS